MKFKQVDTLGTIQYDELVEFKRLMHSINPRLDWRMLILSEREVCPTKAGICASAGTRIIHRIYDFHAYLIYLEDCLSQP